MKIRSQFLSMITAFVALGLSASSALADMGIYGDIKRIPYSAVRQAVLAPGSMGLVGHHFMCIYLKTEEGWIIGVAGAHKDPRDEVQHCTNHFLRNTRDSKLALTAKEYAQFVAQYKDHVDSHQEFAMGIDALGMLGTIFTGGYSKPCYREVQAIAGMASDIIEQ